jgi:ribose transport system substrate-binding protein
MKSLPVLSLVAGLTLILSGCSGNNKPNPGKDGHSGDRPAVGFVTNNPAEFWKIVEKGAQDAADEKGVELIFRRPPNGTAAEQKELIDTMLAQGVKAVSISVKDPDNQTPYLDQVAAQVPLLAIDNDADKSKRRCYIGTDNVKGGRAVGKLVKECMPDGGKIALFVGQIEPLNARERVQGVLLELGFELDEKGLPRELASKDGKYKVVRKEPYTDDVKQPEARKNASAVLALEENEPNLCLIGLWAYNPPAILNAVKEAKKEGKVKIVGFDEDLETLKGIDDGYIYATVVQNPYEFGKQSVLTMAALIKGERVDLPKDGKKYVPERIITKGGSNGRLKAVEFRKEVLNLLGK